MKTLLAAVALMLVGCAPSTLAGPCQSTCDCPAMNAPIRCPGRWECNPQKTCEYSCFATCEADGGCATAGQTCTDSFCKSALSCP